MFQRKHTLDRRFKIFQRKTVMFLPDAKSELGVNIVLFDWNKNLYSSLRIDVAGLV